LKGPRFWAKGELFKLISKKLVVLVLKVKEILDSEITGLLIWKGILSVYTFFCSGSGSG